MAEEPVFLNFTNKKVKIRVPVSCWFDGKEFIELEPQDPLSDGFNRWRSNIGSIGGINLSVIRIDDSCLPAEEPNVFLIVPFCISQHPSLSYRIDLVGLGPQIKDENGEFIAYDGLTAGAGLELEGPFNSIL